MALESGTRLGPYQIVNAIGAGGMGEVYKATDTRLGRTVAIKILPEELSGHEDMRVRFEREAQTIAGLSHPNICTLHDVGHEVPLQALGAGRSALEESEPSPEPSAQSPAPVDFLVLEYLEGETLADRIARGALPLAEALTIGIAIADALDKAHRQSVVHRDLKPANVMLTKAGPKLLDFGLAKWTESGGDPGLAAMPTRADVTAKGTMLGTLQYMAPEQIEGKEADARTDIFAFGALLYEMVTGKRAFEGKTQATLISAIMSREPRPMSHLVSVSPPALEHVVERCLAKDPDDRWQSAHSLIVQLRWIAYGDTVGGVAPVAEEDKRHERVTMIALAAVALLVVALAVPAAMSLGGAEPGQRFLYRSPVRGFEDMALAPDGRGFVFVARPSDGPALLYYRPIGALTAVKLDGTNDAAQPFWSPDSRFVGFVAGGALKKVDVTGGPAQNLGPVPGFTGGTWNRAGTILFGSPQGLFRISAEGGAAEPVTTVEDSEKGHYWPHFLPDGNHYVFLNWSGEPADRALFAGALDSSDRTRLLAVESNATYAEPGYLLYHREAAVYAHPFDPGSLAFTGEPARVAGGVSFSSADGRGSFDVSQTGVLLYFEGATSSTSGRGRGTLLRVNPAGQFSWVDRSGRVIEAAGEPGPWGDMDLAPDGTQIALARVEGGTSDIWILDWQRGERGVPTRLTLDPADDSNPVWSHDGTRVAFTSTRNGNPDVFVMNANGVGDAEPLLSSSASESVEDWSRDGKYLAYLLGDDAQADIYALPLDGSAEPFPVVQGPYQKDEAQFSRDGRWLAYTSNESGAFEVYVTSFPETSQRVKASVGGGGQPRWSPDGKELFYRTPEGQAMAVDVTAEPTLSVGSPRVLFTSRFQSGISLDPLRHQWSVSPDGKRFLMRAAQPGSTAFGRRGAFAVPAAPTNLDVTGARGAGAAPAGGRAAEMATGVTVVLDWPSGITREER